MTAEDPREERLPKWAKDKLRILRMRNDELRGKIEEIKGERPDPIAVRDPYTEQVPVAWNYADSIRFRLHGIGDVGDAQQWVDVRRRTEGEIEVSCSRTLAVRPQSSNVICVTVVDR